MNRTVGIVIPAHNAAQYIADQLSALTNQTINRPFSIVVVLNRCTDNTSSVIQEFEDRLDLHLEIADDRPSAAYARNRGAAVSSTDLLLFCDADDRVHPQWVERLVAALETNTVVSGFMVPWSPTPNWLTRRPDRHRALIPPHDRFGTSYPFSGSMGIHRSAFERIGGFNESFSMTCEDVAFGIDAQRHGFTVAFIEDALCDYRTRTSARQTLARSFRWGRGSWLIDVVYYPDVKLSAVREVGKTFLYTCRLLGSRSRVQFGHRLQRTVYQLGRARQAVVVYTAPAGARGHG